MTLKPSVTLYVVFCTVVTVVDVVVVVVFVVGGSTVCPECIVVVVVGCFRQVGVIGGGAEFYAKETDAFFFDGRCRTNEGKLRERLNVH